MKKNELLSHSPSFAVLVDADACPVKNYIVDLCEQYGIRLVMFFDSAHQYEDGYSEVIIVDQGADSVDFALINRLSRGDIVVSQDYGVAMMALARQAYAISPHGMEYHDGNMDSLMMSRYLTKRAVQSGLRVSSMKKRTKQDNVAFVEGFEALLQKVLASNVEE